MEIECLANPPGTPDNRYLHIEAAIAVIEESGLTYEVDALGTTVEGEPDQLWGNEAIAAAYLGGGKAKAG